MKVRCLLILYPLLLIGSILTNAYKRGNGKKLLKWIDWSSKHGPNCEGGIAGECIHRHATDERSKRICERCHVKLLPENQEVGLIFTIVKNQWITAGADNMPIDMNISAIIEVMSLYEIKNLQEVFIRVLNAGRKWIESVRQKAKK